LVRPNIIGRNVLPRAGLLVVAGQPKTHKSMAVDNFMLQRARGAPWLGFPTDPGITLALQAEHADESWQERLRAMTAHDPDPLPAGRLFLKTLRGIYLNTPEGLETIHRLLDETGANCLRIDPLSRYMVGNENSNGNDGMGGVVRAIDKILARGVAVILVHHMSKPSKDDPRIGGVGLRGGSALFAAADSVVTFTKDASDIITVSFELRHGRAPDPLRLVVTEGLWLVPAGVDPELLAVAQLTAAGALTYKVLVAAAEHDLAISESTAKRRISAALKASILEKDEDGLYRAGSRVHEGSTHA
jgi:hypothetical protein